MYNRRKDQHRAEGFIVGALVGAVVAAIASLLFAPKSGKELRKDIGDEKDKALDQADDYLGKARDKGSEVVEDVEEQASSYFDVASDKVDEVADDLTDDAKAARDKGQTYKTYQFKK